MNAQERKNLTKPVLFICDCADKCKYSCPHITPHKKGISCGFTCMYFSYSKCIPYTPKDI